MRKNDSLLSKLDWPLFISFMILVFLGLATVYSVAFNEENPSILRLAKNMANKLFGWGLLFLLDFLFF